MKILIVTQKVDVSNDVLGFMHRWIEEFAKNFEKVTVVCLQKGEYGFSDNTEVLSLGKPAQGWSALSGEKIYQKFWAFLNFYKYVWRERGNYDVVFVHMNPEYVLLGGLLWKILGKKISLWYAHKATPWHLKFAEKFVNVIFTSTKSGCRIESKRIMIIGQGIDTDFFKPMFKQNENKVFNIITVGRISKSKDYKTLLLAVKALIPEGINLKVDIIGAPARPEDFTYLEELESFVSKSKLQAVVRFVGSVPNREIVKYLEAADLFVNMGQTGSLDKAVLEAMSAGLPILTCNEAFVEVLDLYSGSLLVAKQDVNSLADKIKYLYGMPPEKRLELGLALREIIVRDHNLTVFVRKITETLEKL